MEGADILLLCFVWDNWVCKWFFISFSYFWALLIQEERRRSSDNPVPVNELSTSLPGSSRSEPPTTGYYDPCPGLLPHVNAFYERLKVPQPNAETLRLITPPLLKKIARNHHCETTWIVIKEHPTISTISELLGFIIYSDSDITEIEKCTRGQSDNPVWMKYRKGMMIASGFHRISKLKESTDPDKLIRFLMEGSSSVIVTTPLVWDRKKEIIARKWVFKTLRQSMVTWIWLNRG